MVDATDGDARSQSFELIIRSQNIGDDMSNMDGSGGTILVTHQVDQVRDTRTDRVPRAEQIGVVADAATWNV